MNVFLCRITHDGDLHPTLQAIEDHLGEALGLANDAALASSALPYSLRNGASKAIGYIYDAFKALDDTRRLPAGARARYAVYTSLNRKLCGKNEEPVDGFEKYDSYTIVKQCEGRYMVLEADGTLVYNTTTLDMAREFVDVAVPCVKSA
jgi:hypothetical protein